MFVILHTAAISTDTTLFPSILPLQPDRHHVHQHRQRLQRPEPLRVHVPKPPQRINATSQELQRCHCTTKPCLHASRRLPTRRPRRRSQDWYLPLKIRLFSSIARLTKSQKLHHTSQMPDPSPSNGTPQPPTTTPSATLTTNRPSNTSSKSAAWAPNPSSTAWP